LSKSSTLRFACGEPNQPYSGVWRVVVSGDDVFIGASKATMGVFKISLHQSGVWAMAATGQSGAVFENENRRAKQWNRPLEHAWGVTRGPSILVPHTSLGSRPLVPEETKKEIVWYAAPSAGAVVEFSMYFIEVGAATRWNPDETVLGELGLARGNRLVLLGAARNPPPGFLGTVEGILRRNVFRMSDPRTFQGGSLLWITQSQDAMAVPMIIDMPVPIGPEIC
jgi:hypothetical protein